jgi:predicted nucleic acid-binding protein
MILIDTNIFLELFLGQEKAEDCEKFLETVSRGSIEAIVTRFSIHATEAILNDPKLILQFIRNIQNSLGLDVYETSLEDEVVTSMLMDKIKLDFDDSLQYYVAKKFGVEAIVSYDRHFDNLDITRKEPSDFLSQL